MENIIYTSIGPVLHLNKAGELAQKRMKAAKLCDGLYITEPDKSGYTQFICELNGVVWLDCKAAENRIADGIKLMPGYFDKIKAGCFDGENFPEFKREISRRINHPDSPAIMELKKPERKKTAPLPEGAKKVSVLMFKGCTDEIIDKKVIINEVAPHVYTHTYKLKGYGERVKIIFEIDSVYFQGADNGAYVMAREDFNEICAKAYEHARENVADGAAKGMQYFVEVQKRIDAATSPEVAQTTDTDAAITLPTEDINYMFYIKPKGAKRFSTYNPGKGTMNTGRVFTELYRKEHLPAVCKWIAEDKSGDFAYQLRSGDGKKIFWEHNPTAATPSETPQISTGTAEIGNVSADGKIVEEAAINTSEREITYFHYTPEQLKRYIIDVYEKYANEEWVLQRQIDTDAGDWDVVDGKVVRWLDCGRKKFMALNMDFNSPTCGTCYKVNRIYQKDNFIVSNEKLLEFTVNGNYHCIEKQTLSNGKHSCCYTIKDAHGEFEVSDFSYTKEGIMQRFDKWWKDYATIIWKAPEPNNPDGTPNGEESPPTELSQPAETPQTVANPTHADNSQETALKRPYSVIRNCLTTHTRQKLGTQGDSMLADASVSLAAINAPPIRGDFVPTGSTR